MMRGAAEWPEAEARVEARFAHGAVAKIEVVAETVALDASRLSHRASARVATQLRMIKLGDGIRITASLDQIAGVLLRMIEKPADHIMEISAVVGQFMHRTRTKI